MVDREILEQRTAHVLHHVARLRARREVEAAALRTDEDLWNAVLMDLQQAIQGCIDLATHACVDDRLGSPTSAAEAFELLGRAGRLDDALVGKLAGAAGLRNLIVHQYAVLRCGHRGVDHPQRPRRSRGVPARRGLDPGRPLNRA